MSMFFNIYGEYIIRRILDNWKGGFTVGAKRIANLRYTDDTVLLATFMDDMEELIQRLVMESEKVGLTINKNKTKFIIIDRVGKQRG